MSILNRLRDWLRPATARTVHDGYGPAVLRQGGASPAPDIDGKIESAQAHLEAQRAEYAEQVRLLRASAKRAKAKRAREAGRKLRAVEGGKR